jgi:hypothetical protein
MPLEVLPFQVIFRTKISSFIYPSPVEELLLLLQDSPYWRSPRMGKTRLMPWDIYRDVLHLLQISRRARHVELFTDVSDISSWPLICQFTVYVAMCESPYHHIDPFLLSREEGLISVCAHFCRPVMYPPCLFSDAVSYFRNLIILVKRHERCTIMCIDAASIHIKVWLYLE